MRGPLDTVWAGLLLQFNPGDAGGYDLSSYLFTNSTVYRTVNLGSYVNFAAGDVVHFAITYNDTDKIIRLYVNGTLHCYSDALPNANTYCYNTGATKVWNYAKTNFNDRDVEQN